MPHPTQGLTAGSPVPDFKLEATDNKTYSNDHLLGKPYLIYFLRGTW